MTLAAIYFAMLLTNWGNPVYLNGSTEFFNNNNSNNASKWC